MIISKETEQQIKWLLAQNKRIEAIKLVVKETKCGLKNAINYIDNIQYKQPIMPAAGTDQRDHHGVPPVNPQSFHSNPAMRSRETQLDDIIRQQGLNTKKTGCFIATACYGDYDAPEVLVLRSFRDQRLITSFSGRTFVQFYYWISPAIAKQLDKSEKMKKLIRVYFLKPIIKLLSASGKPL